MKIIAPSLTLLCFTTHMAAADLLVSFDEGAPKDRFTFENNSKCAIKASTLTLDLSGSSAGLIFDVTASGAGVQVFQPLELVSGAQALSGIPKVRDGDTQIRFNIGELPAGDAIAFTIDVDDTLTQQGTMVSNAEISGASVTLTFDGTTQTATIGNTSTAVVPLGDCANS